MVDDVLIYQHKPMRSTRSWQHYAVHSVLMFVRPCVCHPRPNNITLRDILG